MPFGLCVRVFHKIESNTVYIYVRIKMILGIYPFAIATFAFRSFLNLNLLWQTDIFPYSTIIGLLEYTLNKARHTLR